MIIPLPGREIYVPIGHVMFFLRVREIEHLRRYLAPMTKTDRLLDIGCGEGYWSGRLAAGVSRAVGVDIGPRQIRTACRFNSRAGCAFCVGDTASLPFRDKSFEKIVSVCVLEHVPRDTEALKEMRRVARDSGVVALSVDSYSNPEIPTAFKQWQCRRFGVARHYRIEDLQEKARQAGLAVTDHTYICNNRLSLSLALLAIRARPLLYGVSPLMAEVTRRLDARTPQSGWGVILAARMIPESAGAIV